MAGLTSATVGRQSPTEKIQSSERFQDQKTRAFAAKAQRPLSRPRPGDSIRASAFSEGRPGRREDRSRSVAQAFRAAAAPAQPGAVPRRQSREVEPKQRFTSRVIVGRIAALFAGLVLSAATAAAAGPPPSITVGPNNMFYAVVVAGREPSRAIGTRVRGCVIAPGTRCPRARLGGARLFGVQLQYARLGGAGLRGARLSLADLAYARAAGADLRRARLTGAGAAYVDLREARLDHARLWSGGFARADLTHASLWR
ncbi:MAG: pentapeptide repeat-containing protein [Solirubrobacterales bacterium]|nr:pentapeptide repeat-containing protein [Solirubrobacterales bacterium]